VLAGLRRAIVDIAKLRRAAQRLGCGNPRGPLDQGGMLPRHRFAEFHSVHFAPALTMLRNRLLREHGKNIGNLRLRIFP
jgi:hypothetical protein